jgi:hypothetical protein
VLAREPAQELEPLVDLDQPLRIAARALRVARELARRLVQLRRRPAHRPSQRGQLGIDGRHLLDALRRPRRRGLRQQLRRLLRPRAQLLRRRQHPPLLRELLVLAGRGVRLDQLVELEGQPIRPLGTLRLVPVQPRARSLRLRQRGEGLRVLPPQIAQLRVAVQEVEVELRVEQVHVLVLPGDVEQPAGGGLKLGRGGQGSVDPRPAAPFAVHRAAHHQLVARRRQPERGQARVAALRVAGPEQRLHLGLLRSGAHGIRLGPAAEEQVQRVDQDALSRPRLARQHVEAGGEAHLQLLDDGEGPHPQELQHAGNLPEGSDSATLRGCSFPAIPDSTSS